VGRRRYPGGIGWEWDGAGMRAPPRGVRWTNGG
jgi:hypothetical protein